MPSLVLSGLQSVYRLTARKHRQLRAECEQLITAIQADDAAQQAAIAASTTSSSSSAASPSFISDSDADKYFLPFKLACESDNAKMIATALNCIEKLIAYGYLDGASYADPEVYPVKKTEGEQKESKEKEKERGTEERKTAASTSAGGAKADASSSASDSRRLISVIVDTIHTCSFNRDREVQLQSLKAILTAVTSVSCQVHGQPLVTAAYSCWNIHLQAVDDIIKNTAKATLTQLFNLGFQRMESFAVQLRQLEQSAALSAAVAGDGEKTKGKKAGEAAEREGKVKEKEKEKAKEEQKEKDSRGERDSPREKANAREKERIESEKRDEEKVEEKVRAEDEKGKERESETAAASPAPEVDSEAAAESPPVREEQREGDEEKAPSASPEAAAASDGSGAAPPPSVVDVVSPSGVLSPLSPSASPSPPPSVPERPPPGKHGYCVVCGKPANHFCLQTRASVCSMEHKLINLQRMDKKSTIASDVQKKIQAKFIILQSDAYLLLRALIRISKKPLPTPPDPSAVDSKLLSLELLLSIMKQPGPTFRTSPQFVSYVKVEVVDSILKNSDASIEALFSLSSTLFVYLVKHFKAHLHKIIGPVLDSIYIPYIANGNSSYDVKQASLLVLKQIAADSLTIVELFLNYDCEISSLNTFQKIATTLEKTVQGSYFGSSDALTELDESRLKMIGLEALVETMKSLVEWTRRGEEWEMKKVMLAAKKEEEREADDEPSSRSSSPTAAKSPSASSSRFASNGSHRSPSPSTISPPNEDDDPRSSRHEDTYVAASSTSSTFSSQFHQLRQQKQKLDTGILRFNMKPKKGLQYLFEHGLLDNTPEAVAAFFHANGSLDKTQVGDFMGEEAEFNKKVLYAYVEQMSFFGLAFDDGIRAFVSGFRLPGEAQKIDRMMEKFAAQYHLHNPGMFSSADTAYVLAYSVILLNSDAHNPQVKNRMTKEEFFRNNRGIDNGHDINPAFLSDIYDRIVTNEIRMKDDPYRHLIKNSEEVGGQKRVNLFMKESQQMVKKTQDLIRAISVKGAAGKGDRRALDDHAEEGEGASGAVGGGGGGGKGGKKEERPFYLAQDSDWQACGAMFEILWYPSLATFSVLLEENESEAMIELCLSGYRHAIRISNALNMETSRLAFVTSLKKFTLLGSSKEMRTKNIHAVKMLLQIVNSEGNFLKESWGEVLTMVSEVERLHLIATSNKPQAEVFVGESQLKGTAVAPSPAPSQVAVGKNRDMDNVNAGKLLIDVALIERVFIHSANLNGDAIVDFVTALVRVSEHELSSPQPRVFSLQKIVEITYYNMGRIRLVWSKIWVILSDFFIKAGCLTGDHMVLTRSGWRSITTLRKKDVVASLNVETWAMEWKEVTDTQRFKVKAGQTHHDLFRMQGDGMDVVATRDHRMLTVRLNHGLQKEQPLGYETVNDVLTKYQYKANSGVTLTAFEYNHSRAVVRAGINRQLAFKLVIPGLEASCDWWWQKDQQHAFLRLYGFWLSDGNLVVRDKDRQVQIGQRKVQSTAWLMDLLDDVFPRWWRCHTKNANTTSITFFFTIRCPPLYDWLRPRAAGPVGYNPLDGSALRHYPHFTPDNDLAAHELQTRYRSAGASQLKKWTEAAMLAAFTVGPVRSHTHCSICQEQGRGMLYCSGKGCRKADTITRAHPDCADCAETLWLCRECSGGEVDPEQCWWCAGTASKEGNEMVMCSSEGCSAGGHLLCAGLTAVPEGDWLCPECGSGSSEDEAISATGSVAGSSDMSTKEECVEGQASLMEEKEEEDRDDEDDDGGEDDDEEALEGTTSPTQAVASVVWNNGVWHIDMNGHWFHLKRWMGPDVSSSVANLSQSQAQGLLEGFTRADGVYASVQVKKTGEACGAWKCSSSSFPLIDHLQLVGQLAGARVDLSRSTRAGSTRVIEGRVVSFKAGQWRLTFNFECKSGAPVPINDLARPVEVSADVDARGYYDYDDDGHVYDITVADNHNFLTQRQSMKKHEGAKGKKAAGQDVRAHPVFVGNCHSNLGVSLYAIDSLRQLAMKFLEKDELAAFQFQKQFFRPFELVMQQNASVEARELIIGCLSRMILARKKNIKSGWRAVFVVLAIAGQQSHAPLIQSSADLLSSIMEQNFALITEIDCMDECVNCLVTFGSQSVYTEVSLQAIHYLTLCAAHMGAVPQSADGTRSAVSTPRHRSGSISSASGAPLVGAPTSQLSVALSTEVDEHSAPYSASAPVTPVSLTSYAVLPSLTVANQAHLLKVWFLLLTGLSRLVNDGRAEVRHLSLTTLFAILNENGHVFAASTWRAIFHGVLLPIFDDIRMDSHDGRSSADQAALNNTSSDAAQEEDVLNQWLQTTCLEALSSLIQLFTRFYPTTHFLLPELVRLLSGCIQQENEVLAKLGVECFGLLMKEGARHWSVGSTWIVLEAVMDIIKRTLPTALLSPKVRQLLGLTPLRNPTASRKTQPEATADTTDTDPPTKPAQNGAAAEESKQGESTLPRSLTVDSFDAQQAQSTVAPSPLSETGRSRSTSSSALSSPPNLAHFFSTPLIHTRCKVQLLLQQALFDAIQLAFPQRDGYVISVLPSAQSHPKEGHFRQTSGGGDHDATTPSSRATSAAATTPPAAPDHPTESTPQAALGHPTIDTEVGTDSARRPSSAGGWDRYHRRDDPRIFGHLLPSHLLYCLSIHSLTLSFAHSFNADIALRKKLYQAGFIIEQTGRLPQLFELEAKVTGFAWTSMFRMWKEGGSPEALSAETGGSAEAGAALAELDHLPAGREADVLSSPRVVSMISAPASASYSAAYAASVLLSYHRMSLLTTRLLTDYLTKTQAGQLVSLEHVDDVVAQMVDAYASLSLDLFECDLDVMVPLLGELCEWGSINVRGAVRKWIQGKGMRMMRLARSLRHLAGRAGLEEEEEEEEDDEDEEEDGEGGAEEQGERAAAPQQPTAAAASAGVETTSKKAAAADAPPANGEAPKMEESSVADAASSTP